MRVKPISYTYLSFAAVALAGSSLVSVSQAQPKTATPIAKPAVPVSGQAVPKKPLLSKEEQAKVVFNAATKLLLSNKMDAAAQKYLEALNLDPKLVPAYQNLGAIYVRQKKWPSAEEVFRRIVALKPGSVDALLSLASVQKESGQPGASQDTLRRAVSLFPSSVPARLFLAQSFQDQGQPNLAEEQLQSAVAANPKSLPAAQALARFYFQQKRTDDYNKVLERIWPLDSKNPKLAFELGVIAHRKKDLGKAITFYRAATRLDPKSQSAWQNLGAAYADLKRYKESRDAFARAAKLGGGDLRIQMGLGIAQFNNGNYAGAEAAFRKAVKLAPNDLQAKKNLAAALIRQNKLKEAEPTLAQLRAKGNTDMEVVQSLAYLYVSSNRQKQAIELYKKGIAAHPNAPDLHKNLGTLYLQTNQNDNAIAEFREALRLKPDDESMVGLLGYLLQQNKKNDEAIALYEAHAAKSPAFYQRIADLYRTEGKPDQQTEALVKWTQADSKNPDAWITLSSVYEEQKKLKEAREALEHGIAANPEQVQLLKTLASFQKRQGNSGQAEDTLRNALKKAPGDASLHAALAEQVSLSDPEEAILQYQLAEANEKNPQMAAQYGLQSVLLMKKSGKVETLSQFVRLAKKYPTHTGIRLEWGTALADQQKYSEAADQAKTALLANPNAFPDGPRALQLYSTWARSAHREGEVVATLKSLAENHPENNSVLYQLSSTLAESMQQQKIPANAADPGLAFFKKLAAKNPKASGLPWAMADYAGRRGLVSERIAIMETLAAQDTKSPAAPSSLGSIYKDLKQWEKAEAAYREAVRRSPTASYYRTQLARELEAAGKPKEALAAYQEARMLEPANVEIAEAIKRLNGGAANSSTSQK
jgi:tetratricopeptide (TPR) repeat protein